MTAAARPLLIPLYLTLCVGWMVKGLAFCRSDVAGAWGTWFIMGSVMLERATSALGSALLDDVKWRVRQCEAAAPHPTNTPGGATSAKAWSSRADILMRMPVGILRLFRLLAGCQIVHLAGTKYRGLVSPELFLISACAAAATCGTVAFVHLRTRRTLPTDAAGSVALVVALLAVGLYNLPDGQSHVLRHLLSADQRRALDTTGLACVALEGLAFLAWVRASAPSLTAVIPPHLRRAALWLALANIVTCGMLAATMLYYFSNPALGSGADVAALVVKALLVPWLMQALAVERNVFTHAAVARKTLACLSAAAAALVGWPTTCARIAVVAVLWCQDALLDEYNSRISTWFAAAQKNACLLVMIYATRVHFLHASYADAAGAALLLARPWYVAGWLCVLAWGPTRIAEDAETAATHDRKII